MKTKKFTYKEHKVEIKKIDVELGDDFNAVRVDLTINGKYFEFFEFIDYYIDDYTREESDLFITDGTGDSHFSVSDNHDKYSEFIRSLDEDETTINGENLHYKILAVINTFFKEEYKAYKTAYGVE